MKDTISNDDMFVDIIKTELKQADQRNELLQDM